MTFYLIRFLKPVFPYPPQWQEVRLDIDALANPDITGTLQAHGFANTASLRRGHPYYDIWAVASKHPVDENTLRQLAMEHFPA